MTISIDTNQEPAMPQPFYHLLIQELEDVSPKEANAITLYFRDPDYSPEQGGFHPVEVRLEKQLNQWRLVYVTDFAFHGFPYPELIKDIDICFNSKQVYSSIGGWINHDEAKELIELFSDNFTSYHHMDVYQVQVNLG
ncbi:DUF2787 domain-containing protein [Shewanella basaltis]|uniref:DUF2787 domain-containing protein n=1 Tax=Shewanella basaltis TaxID=472183 RepID=UPI00200E5562|nr:DUF2787 domain-containing protein [Shewanella basaltis]MCL1115467.1 DUF2787 domain-containing protein [Shewanella basaltis]|tara:strand:+ start:775 stop:1188 length:414 start_codon:yes stop_codon:yes gene_type:complete